MNKIVNGVANDYEFPDLDWMHHDSKTINENYVQHLQQQIDQSQEIMAELTEENERLKEGKNE